MTDMSNRPRPPTPLNAEQINDHLDYILDGLVRRIDDELLPALWQTAKVLPTITNAEEEGVVTENLRMANVAIRLAKEHHQSEKLPFLSGGRAVDTWFRELTGRLVDAMIPVQAALTEYKTRLLEAERAAARRAQEAAQAEADRRAEEAGRAMRERPEQAGRALDAAAKSAEEADKATQRAEGRSSSLTRSRGPMGAVSSLRTTWAWEVADFDAVPREYLTVDADAIKNAARQRDASGRPTTVIPGIRWVERQTAQVR